ncbi:UvrD-helicase domain-containing protein [Opitutus sp. GAS368]|uniref:UvrD-helicase domain-containing protein n=1 Tax=Opitutus sp. GAS368 TaxID=1882749 RepID=UPI00087BC0C6|nr:UvrD-helicase domain-containing protein [Opitutus sp. GAS368]SDS10854.1 DNA helicase-2 / ATP-dependent DNA helicase PcrA [Opitutus sp. GAS368]
MSSPPQPPKEPTEEQNAVLISPARVRVVRACPGAGKTEMFVEAIRRELKSWNKPAGGVAALSFTNVARQTIEARVGGVVGAPHFIGTLDGFAFRFVVKPFGHLVGLPAGGVRLFPAAMCAQFTQPTVQVGGQPKERATLFQVHFSGVEKKLPVLRAEAAYRQITVPAERVQEIFDAKKNYWAKTGIVTHSDCHFLAAAILKKGGAAVRGLIARRFPVIFIDELQDTGFFLARTFVRLCEDPGIKALVVGDPNQAIYGFGGASPTIFDDFQALEGATPFALTLSQRCPKKVSQVVSALSYSKAPVNARPDAADGELALVVHSLAIPKLLPPQAAFLRGLGVGTSLAIISRRTTTANSLRGAIIRDEFCGRSGVARKINLAAEYLANGDPATAVTIIDRELCRVVFDDPQAGLEERKGKGITPAQWRAAIFGILTAALAKVEGETWNAWVQRIKAAVQAACVSLGWQLNETSGLKAYMICNETGNAPRNQLIEIPVAPLWPVGDTVSTIHKVKGAEFETVIVFAPKPSKGHPCPAKEWWSDEAQGEERRVGFVGVSRAKQKLILCVHVSTLKELQAKQPEFVALFGEPIPMPAGA